VIQLRIELGILASQASAFTTYRCDVTILYSNAGSLKCYLTVILALIDQRLLLQFETVRFYFAGKRVSKSLIFEAVQ